MPYDLTPEKIDQEILALATAHPDTVYEAPLTSGTCSYVSGATPSGSGCIFGQALQRLGVPTSVLAQWEESHADTAIENLAEFLLVEPRKYWDTVQESQDNGTRWGDAIRAIKRAS